MENKDLETKLATIEARLKVLEKTVRVSSSSLYNLELDEANYFNNNMAEPEIKLPKMEYSNSNWLAIIAVICFVLAGGFIIKLSIDSGWLTPIRQLGIATLFGLSLILSRYALQNKTDAIYASYLPAAGVIILYLTALAGYLYYHIFSFEIAIFLTCLVSILCIFLYWQIKQDIYAIIAATGAYIAPVLMNLQANSVVVLYYFLICSATFSIISIWVSFRTLALISAYLAIFLSGIVGKLLYLPKIVAVVLPIHFVIFAIGAYFYSRIRKTSLTMAEACSFFPVLFLFYGIEYNLISDIYPGFAPWLSIAFAALLIGLYLSAKRYLFDNAGSEFLTLSFATLIFFHSFYLELLPDNLHPWLFIIILLGVAFVPFNLDARIRTVSYIIPLVGVILICAIEYFSMIYRLFFYKNLSVEQFIQVFMAAFSVWAVIIKAPRALFDKDRYKSLFLIVAHLLVIVGTYQLTKEEGSLAVSASWLLYAVIVVVYAYNKKDKIMIRSALSVLALAAGKALLYDAYAAVAIIRIVCLILTGLVLYSCGLLLRKTSNWKK